VFSRDLLVVLLLLLLRGIAGGKKVMEKIKGLSKQIKLN
jgi:hypothetical protein